MYSFTCLIDNLTVEELKESLSSLLKFSVKLAGLANVVDVLESSFKDSLSAKLHDLYHLQENILKTKQVNLLKLSFINSRLSSMYMRKIACHVCK